MNQEQGGASQEDQKKLFQPKPMTDEDTRLLNEVLDSIAPENPTEPVEPEEPADDGKGMLELKKLKLKLLEMNNG